MATKSRLEQWKRQLGNLNVLSCWMLVRGDVSDDEALIAARELDAFLEEVHDLLTVGTSEEE